MISYEIIKDGVPQCVRQALSQYSADTLEYAEEVVGSFLELASSGGVGVGLTLFSDCILVRIDSDGEYLFVYPIPLCDRADVRAACLEIAKYARKEVLPLSFTDVPRSDIAFLGNIFPHIDASCYEDDEDTFFVSVRNECSSVGEFPEICVGDISLGEITEADRDEYAALCSDKELNRYWGYDVSLDNPDADADLYIKIARSEYNAGVAIALAVRYCGTFVGEAVVYDFDYFGGASIGVRILPEYHSRGIGSAATSALIELCRGLGLKELRTKVMEQNVPSIRMTEKLMLRQGTEGGCVAFVLKL